MNSEQVLNLFQSVYRHHHSTEIALLKITNDILAEIDHKRLTLLVLLNFSAAFDTIAHNILIECLRSTFNTSSTALERFNSYVLNREQSVHIGASKSSTSTMKKGVPQRSVLGLALHTMYNTPMHYIVMNCKISAHYYADDTQLYLSFEPVEYQISIKCMEAYISDMMQWLLSNNLALNTTKTEILLFNTRQQLTKVSKSVAVCIGDSAINTSITA